MIGSRIPVPAPLIRLDQNGPQLAQLVAHGRDHFDDRLAHAASVL
jgi:hypothetical protein